MSELTPHQAAQAKLARIRASEGQHLAHDAANDPDKATVGWALACLAVLVGIVICAIAQSPGGGQ